MNQNLGQSSLRRRRHPGKPMETFDGLPAPLRKWLADAALPWSPSSALRIWSKSASKGMNADDILEALSRAEAKTLARDKTVIPFKN